MNTWENIKQEDSYNDDDDSIDADGDDELNNDAEGVWSPDIEQSFQEALAIYPPCGRRKIILSEEGKMYGRNELIARYIKLRTGKTRTRKQVSSHIQVLAKRKTKDGKEIIGCGGGGGPVVGGQGNKPNQGLTSAQIISPLNTNKSFLNYANQVPPSNTLQQQIRPPPQQLQQQQQQQQQSQMYQNNVMNSQNQPIWSHPGLQVDSKALVQAAAAAAAAAAASSFYPQSTNFSPEVLAAALATTPSAGARLNTPNSASSSPSQTPPPSSSNCSQQSLQSHLWQQQQQQQQQLLPKTLGSHRLHLTEFSGFLEQRRDLEFYHKHLFVHLNPEMHTGEDFECINVKEFSDKFPDNDLLSDKRISYLVKFWVDLNYTFPEALDGVNSLYAVTNIFESTEMLTISCSTKVCSFGNLVVEKVETEHSRYENGRYVYRFENSPMCEYMITFINKLKQLPEESLKNSVLENFSVLQLVKITIHKRYY